MIYLLIVLLIQVKRPNIVDWSPVVVIANKMSGNGEGDIVLQKFRMVLNPCQVNSKIQPQLFTS